jgi:signal transduction histidine kinase
MLFAAASAEGHAAAPATPASGPPDGVVHVTTAQVYVQPRADNPEFIPPAADAAGWREVRLPAIVPKGRESGEVLHWYRVRVAHDGAARLAVLIPRAHVGYGGAYVNVRGQWLDGPEASDVLWNMPYFLPVPDPLVTRDDPGTLEVLVLVDFAGPAGMALTDFYVGPRERLAPMAGRLAFLMQDAPHATALALLLLGAFAFGVWIRRRNEVAYLLFAAATVVWYGRTLHYWTGPSPDVAHLFWWLTINSLSWLMVLIYLFAFRLQGKGYPRLERVLFALVAAAAILTLPGVLADRMQITGTFAYAVQAVVALAVTMLVTRSSLEDGKRESIVLAAALWLNLAAGVHDLLLKEWLIDPRGFYLMPYGGILIFGAFLYAVQRRYVGAIADVERANDVLEARLAERTRELQASHERLRAVEREQTLVAERQRLMSDMHDGLGSSLMSSLVMVERGSASPAEVATVLRDCIDDLKLAIDSLEPAGSDLVSLLGIVRYRLGRRLERAGLRLDWRVTDLPALPWLDSMATLEVLRILQEALTNVVKHSGAATVVVETASSATEVIVRVLDDGRGFDPVSARRKRGARGLLNLERRAAKLGGRVAFRSGAGGTTVELTLPIDRPLSTGTAPAA